MSKNTRTYLVYITMAVLIVGLCVAIWISKSDILFLALGILLLSIVLFVLLLISATRRIKMRKLESVGKGKKLVEAVENPLKSKQIMAGVIVYICAVLVAIIFGVIEVIQGNTKFSIIPIIATLPAVITAFSPKKCYIYENGIQCRVWFIRWDEIKDFEWKNKVLRIKAKHIRRELLIEDENGNIRKIVEKMVKK